MKHFTDLFVAYRTATIIFVAGIILTILLSALQYRKIEQNRLRKAEDTIIKHATAIQSALDHRLFSLESLNAFVHSNAQLNLKFADQEQAFKNRFQAFADELHTSVDGILSLQLAPQGVIRYVTGSQNNNKALNYDLFESDSRKEQIIRAIYDYRQVITGPISLVQGGDAIIARKAIFAEASPNATSKRLKERLLISDGAPVPNDFWGLATVLFTPQALLQEAGLTGITNKEFSYALKGRHGLGHDGEIFWGDAAVFDAPTYIAPVSFDAGEWLLGIKYTKPIPLFSLLFIPLLGSLLTLFAVYAECLVSRNRRAEELDKAKDAFLASMSHEIRSPLNGVVGMTSLLKSSNLTDEQLKMVEIIDASSSQLSAVIGDILDFSKIKAGKVELDYRTVPLAEQFESCLNIILPQAKSKSQQISLNIAQSLQHAHFRTDTTRLKQILINLLSNAVKFTGEYGVIELAVDSHEDHDKTMLEIMISDNGIGMSEAQINRLFQSFSQADASTTRRYGGTGLGLVISQNLSKMMGGDITVTSTIDKGSRFTVILPLQVEAPPIRQEAIKPPLGSQDRHLKILVADDLPMNLTMMVMMLQKIGYSPDTANNGIEAVALQERNQYDLIFMDWEMPEMDGVEATKLIREKHSTEHSPWIIALTANSSSTHRYQCIAAGMNEYLAKPVSIDQIQEKISDLRRQRLTTKP